MAIFGDLVLYACQQKGSVLKHTATQGAKEVNQKDSSCENWECPTGTDLKHILGLMDTLSPMEWNECFGDWECGNEGQLSVEGLRVDYWVDAAGWIITKRDSVQTFYGYKNKTCWAYFPAKPMCDSLGIFIKPVAE